MNWKIVLTGKEIGTVLHPTLTEGMPQWCNGVCYLVDRLDFKKRVVAVKEHPANAGK